VQQQLRKNTIFCGIKKPTMPTAYRTQTILKTILIAGLVAGTLDIVGACTHAYLSKGTQPEIVLKYIAGGVFTTKESMAGGSGMAAWGLLFHFIIAFSLAAFFVLIYTKWKALHILSMLEMVVVGQAYAVFAWIVTTQLIIRFISTLKYQLPFFDRAVVAIVILMFLLGIPIALITHKFLRRPVAA
jgi:hypothetical protein